MVIIKVNTMMTQKRLPFKYKEEKKKSKTIRYSGLLPILELAKRIGLFRFADNRLRVRTGDQGWLDSQILLSIFSLNVLGGDSVSDIEHLESDEGLCTVLGHCEGRLLNKRKIDICGRFRKGRSLFFPSDNAIHNYMELFHDELQEQRREEFLLHDKAFIPSPNQYTRRLSSFFRHISSFCQRNHPVRSATIDVDAVISTSSKHTALYTYEKEQGYQPINAYWHEQGLVINTEFRDGNVPSNHAVPGFVERAFSNLPEEVKVRFFRMDAAGYNFDLMEYCHDNGIGFGISVPLCKSLKGEILNVKEDDWNDVSLTREQLLKRTRLDIDSEESGWQWSELDYVSDDKRGDKYRYIAIRSRIPNQGKLFDSEVDGESESDAASGDHDQKKKVYEKDGVRYRVRVIVSNREDIDGEALFHWYNKRCGRSEQIHDTMKNELAGGQFPSYKFGVNAFWWTMVTISLNILEIYKRLVLGGCWLRRRMKALRFHLIYLAGRVEKASRTVFVYLHGIDFFEKLREKIMELKWVPI